MSKWDKLEKAADLLVELAKQENTSTTKSASSYSGLGEEDSTTALKVALYMNVKKAHYIEALRGLQNEQ